jgi:hypothetical protein
MAGLRKVLDFDGREVIARELTTAECRQWLDNLEKRKFELFNEQFFAEHGVGVEDICLMTNLTPAKVNALFPSEMVQVIQAIKETNETFFQFRAWLKKELTPAPGNGLTNSNDAT